MFFQTKRQVLIDMLTTRRLADVIRSTQYTYSSTSDSIVIVITVRYVRLMARAVRVTLVRPT